jgi:hypothetical protein
MQAGDLRKSDPLKAADDFLDLVISARYLTAVVLGQDQNPPMPRSHVKHAVEIFLNYYGVQNGESQLGKRARRSRSAKRLS